MKRAFLAWMLAAGLSLVLSTGAARADEAPAAEDVRKAASAFDAGSRAYREERFEAAASHFEAADEAVPSARALRMAIRSRDQAGQAARAATLAAQALARHPKDNKTRELADATLEKYAAGLHRLEVSCAEPCVVAIGSRAVPGKAREQWVVYLDPGAVSLSASFVNGQGSEDQEVSARAGGNNTLSFLPSPDPGPEPPPPPSPPADASPLPAPAPSEPEEPVPPPEERMWIEHPGVFVALAVVTAGLGGVTIWSGIDTIENPGADTVREKCRGEGTDCREYQEGLEKQLRTNILIGGTAAMAAVTLLFGVLVTEWEIEADTPEAALVILPGGGAAEFGGRF